MYDIQKVLENEGVEISARSVARVLSEHGITLKKNEEETLAKEPKGEIEKTEPLEFI